jgi:peptide/nickel transport system substrate-binding protein
MRTVQPVQGITEAFQQTAKRAGIDVEILPGDGKQTLTKYRARTHDIYIGQWGRDYWDPHTNADTFARNRQRRRRQVEAARVRNAGSIPELTQEVRSRLCSSATPAKRKVMYEDDAGRLPQETVPFVMLYQQTTVRRSRSDFFDGLKLRPDVRYHVTCSGCRKADRAPASG